MVTKRGRKRQSVDRVEEDKEHLSTSVSNQKLNVRCSPLRFGKMCAHLSGRRRALVKGMGFGGLLEMASVHICHKLIMWMLDNFKEEDCPLTICGKTFVLTMELFGEVMGLSDGGDDFEQQGTDEEVINRKKEIMDGRRHLQLSDLEDDLLDDKHPDDIFIRKFLLFASGTILMPTTTVVVFYLHHLEGHSQFIDRSKVPITAWTEKKTRAVLRWIKASGGYSVKKMRSSMVEESGVGRRTVETHALNIMTEVNRTKDVVSELAQQLSKFKEDMLDVIRREVRVVTSEALDEANSNAEKSDEVRRSVANKSTDTEGIQNDAPSCEPPIKHVEGAANERTSISEIMRGMDNVEDEFASVFKSLNRIKSGQSKRNVVGSSDLKTNVNGWLAAIDPPDSLRSDEVVDVTMECIEISDSETHIAESVRQNHLRDPTCLLKEYVVLCATLKDEGIQKHIKLMHYAEDEEWRRNFLGDVGACDKIVIPCYSSEDLHWFLAVLDLNHQQVEIWDSLPHPRSRHRRGCIAMDSVSVLANFLVSDLELAYDDGLNLSSFKVVHKKDIPTQANGNDCGIFALKFMWAVATGNTVDSKFDSEEARFFLGLELVRSKMNNVREGTLNAAYKHSKDVMSRYSLQELSTTTEEKVSAPSVVDPEPGVQNLAYATKKKRALRWGRKG
ncbi:Sentrin-specific protease [Morus notabilis]|uniref:Sentrin-specific protease n=1 Tax=Morus notabilis TaxID=981085 RepID=W9QIH0_9ROSA|nr:Sentrin-specific protease [Morus notabilis]